MQTKKQTKKKNPYNPLSWIIGKPTIGDGTWIGAFCLIDALHAPLSIGKGCDIASGAHILTHSSVHRCLSERQYDKVDAKPTVVEDCCFIGANSTILMGSTIGHHSIVAAGTIILEDTIIPPYSLVAGNPGKVIGNTKKYLK